MFVIKPNPLKIIDLSNEDQETAEELVQAAATQGFLFIEGHNFTQAEVDQLFQISREFFHLPHDYKRQYAIDETNHGYADFGGETLDPIHQKKGDPKEALNISGLDFTTGKSTKPIPDWFTQDPKREALINETIIKLYQLSIKILRFIARGFKIEDIGDLKGEDWFGTKCAPEKPSGSTFRLLHYPGQKSLDPDTTIRAGAHTDYGSITLLFQKPHEEGLEIYSPVTKHWEAVPFVPGSNKFQGMAPPIVVNIGDLLSYWTSGYLKSTLHRVKFPIPVRETGHDRYSIAFFSHPNDDALLEPVPSELVKNIKREGVRENDDECISAAEHLKRRLAATYGWKSE
ncbi:uncharacterized protein J8A68_000423 [[Candida] subhashii]|uniref:Fe2OG dioxygenase domain-containing protein n=1 Tax=[Candida] subhashii TaxID=561895 RepID=A0A8J5QTG7_9ASCO|nr:uncharacterized protein J8A68_000423 [[Candida] subhashii]KAG7665993.1 hypothetical protein J8A68_000423 [[Candida] subhashii]